MPRGLSQEPTVADDARRAPGRRIIIALAAEYAWHGEQELPEMLSMSLPESLTSYTLWIRSRVSSDSRAHAAPLIQTVLNAASTGVRHPSHGRARVELGSRFGKALWHP